MATGAFTRGPYYGDLEGPGEFDLALRTVGLANEVILIHGNEKRLRLLVNLIAQWNAVGVSHVLLLAFEKSLCDALRVEGRIGCAHSSYLSAGPLADAIRHRELQPQYVAWLQRFRYLRLCLEARVSVLAIDSDVAVLRNPIPLMRSSMGGFPLVTTFDFKGGYGAAPATQAGRRAPDSGPPPASPPARTPAPARSALPTQTAASCGCTTPPSAAPSMSCCATSRLGSPRRSLSRPARRGARGQSTPRSTCGTRTCSTRCFSPPSPATCSCSQARAHAFTGASLRPRRPRRLPPRRLRRGLDHLAPRRPPREALLEAAARPVHGGGDLLVGPGARVAEARRVRRSGPPLPERGRHRPAGGKVVGGRLPRPRPHRGGGSRGGAGGGGGGGRAPAARDAAVAPRRRAALPSEGALPVGLHRRGPRLARRREARGPPRLPTRRAARGRRACPPRARVARLDGERAGLEAETPLVGASPPHPPGEACARQPCTCALLAHQLPRRSAAT